MPRINISIEGDEANINAGGFVTDPVLLQQARSIVQKLHSAAERIPVVPAEATTTTTTTK